MADANYIYTTPGDLDAVRTLQLRAWHGADAKGFHDDQPDEPDARRFYIGNRLMLIVSEAAEALEELRKGRAANETYYPTNPYGEDGRIHKDTADGAPIAHKPEGVPSELADIVIRCLDFAEAEDIDLAAMIDEKLTYNATRGHRHGGKAF